MLDCFLLLLDRHHSIILLPFYAFDLRFQIVLGYCLRRCVMNVAFGVQFLLLVLPLTFLILSIVILIGFLLLIFLVLLVLLDLVFQPFIPHNRTLVNLLQDYSLAFLHSDHALERQPFLISIIYRLLRNLDIHLLAS